MLLTADIIISRMPGRLSNSCSRKHAAYRLFPGNRVLFKRATDSDTPPSISTGHARRSQLKR